MPLQMPMPGMAQPPQVSPLEAMTRQHDEMRMKLNKLEELQSKHKVIRAQLSHLETLGDLVSEDDVLDSASKIVASGIPPMAMAKMLSEMPTQGGEALKSWIAGQEESFKAKELQMEQVLGSIRYETGLAAMRLLAADSFGSLGGAPGGPPQAANPLMPPQPTIAPPQENPLGGGMGDLSAPMGE